MSVNNKGQFASKKLAERNSDSEPFVFYGSPYDVRSRVRPSGDWDFVPRPEFQHGKLEENPILVAFRKSDVSAKSMLKAIRTGNTQSPAGKLVQRVGSHSLGEFRLVPFDGDWALKGGRGGSQRRKEMEDFAFARVNHAERVLALWLRVFG